MPKLALTIAATAITAIATAQNVGLPFRSFSGQAVGIDRNHWAAVAATPFASYQIPPFQFAGKTCTGFYLEADILGGAIFGPGSQFTAGQSDSLNYGWHNNADHIGAGLATLWAGTQRYIRPFVGIGWSF